MIGDERPNKWMTFHPGGLILTMAVVNPETHDRINSVLSFLLFHATCLLASDP